MKKQDNKERLLFLISFEQALNNSYDEAYTWMAEVNYLLNLLNSPTKTVKNILSLIEDLRFHGLSFSEKISQLKAQIKIFKDYEIDSIEFKQS